MGLIGYLRERIRGITKRFGRSAEVAKAVAEWMPLVHVTHLRNLEKIISESSGHLNPSSSKTSKDITMNTIVAVGMRDSLYFYAGRADSAFGSLALRFEAGCERGHTGTAAPFDTGKLLSGEIKSKLNSLEERIEFIKKSLVPLDRWREAFADFLETNFESPMDYLHGRPNRSDPEGIFDDPSNDWAAWVFEVHFHEKQHISAVTTVSYDRAVGTHLLALLEQDSIHAQMLLDKKHGDCSIDGEYEPCAILQEEISKKVGALCKRR